MKTLLTQSLAAVGDGAGGRSGGEDAVYAGRTHFVVTFWVDEELEGGVKVSIRFADGADVIGGVVINGLRGPVAHHLCGWIGVGSRWRA